MIKVEINSACSKDVAEKIMEFLEVECDMEEGEDFVYFEDEDEEDLEEESKIEPIFIKCCDCQDDFEFSEGEQKFYKDKALVPPKRCTKCRRKERERHAGRSNFSSNYS